jgi:hypothetical protein
MQARTVSIKPTTILSAILVAIAIVFAAVSDVRAAPVAVAARS